MDSVDLEQGRLSKLSLGQKSRTRRRLLVSRLFGAGALVAVVCGASRWSLIQPAIAEGLAFVGLLLVSVGAFGRYWCLAYIGGCKKRVLVDVGPYSLCRHPLYFFSLVGAVGLGFSTHTFSAALLVLVGFVLYYPRAIRGEEAFLTRNFAAYADYQKRVPAFFPRWSGYRDVESLEVSPRRLRRELLTTAGAFGFVALADLIDGLHRAGLLPELFRLP
jgi:protein-S-isoprenylcysteine O-methyltransferase Ste14